MENEFFCLLRAIVNKSIKHMRKFNSNNPWERGEMQVRAREASNGQKANEEFFMSTQKFALIMAISWFWIVLGLIFSLNIAMQNEILYYSLK